MLECFSKFGSIKGHKIMIMDDLKAKYPEKFNESGAMDYKWFEADIRPTHHIYVRRDVGSLSFSVRSEAHPNGVSIEAMIRTIRAMVEFEQRRYPSRERAIVLTKLQEAELWLSVSETIKQEDLQ